MMRARATVSTAILGTVLLSGCAAEPEPGPTADQCAELVSQAMYEAMAGAARAGYAADPERLAEGMPSALEGDEVDLPPYEQLEEWDDTRRLNLMERLESIEVGVGGVIDRSAIMHSVDGYGPCEGWIR